MATTLTTITVVSKLTFDRVPLEDVQLITEASRTVKQSSMKETQ
jgi:hypothetical protein